MISGLGHVRTFSVFSYFLVWGIEDRGLPRKKYGQPKEIIFFNRSVKNKTSGESKCSLESEENLRTIDDFWSGLGLFTCVSYFSHVFQILFYSLFFLVFCWYFWSRGEGKGLGKDN